VMRMCLDIVPFRYAFFFACRMRASEAPEP